MVATQDSPPATVPDFPLPLFPKLRAAEPRWIRHDGEPRLWLRDPLELSDQVALVPAALVPLLGALDGTRDLTALRGAFHELTGVALPVAAVAAIVQQLDEALLLESPRADWVRRGAVARFRAAPSRLPALATHSYPADPAKLAALFGHYAAPAAQAAVPLRPIERAAGVLTPHIDYARGGSVYGATWAPAAAAAASADVVLIFGTDHSGSPGRLTLTSQRYATPWGPLPNDPHVVTALVRALGEVHAYGEELHHRKEHSVELAAAWLHWALTVAPGAGGSAHTLPAVVPILCGSFHCYTRDGADAGPDLERVAAAALDALSTVLAGKRVLVIAAADLAHVGPAFGDPQPLAATAKARLRRADAGLLETAARGDAAGFLANLRAEQDQRRVCGLPPIYWALRTMERLASRPMAGVVTQYDQCPADAGAGSVVSIAGMLWQ